MDNHVHLPLTGAKALDLFLHPFTCVFRTSPQAIHARTVLLEANPTVTGGYIQILYRMLDICQLHHKLFG
jgi:hypothetical protein